MRMLPLVVLFSFIILSCKQQTTTTVTTTNAPGATSSSCTIGQWPASSLPINLKMSSEFSGDFNNSMLVGGLNPIEQMAKVWNDSGAGKTFFTVPFPVTNNTGYTDVNSFRDGEMGIYKSHTWFNSVSSTALAITQYYGYLRSSGSLGSYIELTHADIIVNYRDFNSDLVYDTNSLIDYDIPTVVLHEMGHFLGLCHDSSHTSIMRPYYQYPQRSLFNFDKTKIIDLYVNNKNSLNQSSSYSTNAISLPEGTLVKGTVEMLANGKCKHYLNGKLTFEHEVNKKSLDSNKAFLRFYTKAFSKFNQLF